MPGDGLGNVSCARPSVHVFRARFGSMWWQSRMVPSAQPRHQRPGGRCRVIIGKAGGTRWDYELNRRLLEVVRKAVGRDSVDEAGCWLPLATRLPSGGKTDTAREAKPDQWLTPTEKCPRCTAKRMQRVYRQK